MGEDKLFADAGGSPLVSLTLTAAARSGAFDATVIAAPVDRHASLGALARGAGLQGVLLTEGGARRQDSVRLALEHAPNAGIVAVHDAARPLCPPELFAECVRVAEEHGAATAAVPVVDSVKRGQGGLVVESLERGDLYAIQTPQAFHRDLLERAHGEAVESGLQADDDAALVEALGVPVRLVAGSVDNFKVTHPRDLVLLRALLEARA